MEDLVQQEGRNNIDDKDLEKECGLCTFLYRTNAGCPLKQNKSLLFRLACQIKHAEERGGRATL